MKDNNSVKGIIKQTIDFFVHQMKNKSRDFDGEKDRLYTRIVEKFRFSLTVKITAVYAMKIVRILTFLSFMIILGFVTYSVWNAEVRLNKDVSIITNYISGDLQNKQAELRMLSGLENISIQVFNKDKGLLYDLGGDHTFYDKSTKNDQIHINGEYIIVFNNLPKYFDAKWDSNYKKYNFGFELVINKKVKVDSKETFIQISDKMISQSISFMVLCMILLITSFFCMLNIILSGARSARKTLKPIETMTKTVENITINELDTRLDIKGSQDELKDLARTFNKMLDRIQRSYEQQNQFVSDASHELRTPISVIQGYVNMLDRWGKNDGQILQESITAIKSESEGMKELIEKLLFLARGDKNTQKVEKQNFNLQELIDEIIKETRMIDQRHTIENISNMEAIINGDKGLIKEAIRILVDNSIKYTASGGTIKLDTSIKDRFVLIKVEDNGSGIAKEDLPYIFERFYRADKSRAKETGGTGLGLAIAKWIILKHDGKLDVQSEINRGTVVSITLPCVPMKPLI